MLREKTESKDFASIMRNTYNPQDTFSTKEFAEILNVSTPTAYKICLLLEKEELICKYGYKTKYGWEDPEHSKLRPNSVYWQRINFNI